MKTKTKRPLGQSGKPPSGANLIALLEHDWENNQHEIWRKKRYNVAITIAPKIKDISQDEFTYAIEDCLDETNQHIGTKHAISVALYFENSDKAHLHAHGLLRVKRQVTKSKMKQLQCIEVLRSVLRKRFSQAPDLSVHTQQIYDTQGWIQYSRKHSAPSTLPLVM